MNNTLVLSSCCMYHCTSFCLHVAIVELIPHHRLITYNYTETK